MKHFLILMITLFTQNIYAECDLSIPSLTKQTKVFLGIHRGGRCSNSCSFARAEETALINANQQGFSDCQIAPNSKAVEKAENSCFGWGDRTHTCSLKISCMRETKITYSREEFQQAICGKILKCIQDNINSNTAKRTELQKLLDVQRANGC